jgi:hypothetical protein
MGDEYTNRIAFETALSHFFPRMSAKRAIEPFSTHEIQDVTVLSQTRQEWPGFGLSMSRESDPTAKVWITFLTPKTSGTLIHGQGFLMRPGDTVIMRRGFEHVWMTTFTGSSGRALFIVHNEATNDMRLGE